MTSHRFPYARVNWVTSVFLIGTLSVALTAVPWYLWQYGLNWFLVVMFFAYCSATGLSITMGYHRLFSHLSFKAKWPVKLFVLVFGSAAFENSTLDWVSDHRRHHKHVDEEEDPYDISKGFFHAHIGWMLFKLKPEPPLDNVGDLQKDPLVMWQHKYTHLIGAFVGFVLPTLLGAVFGWLSVGTWTAVGVQALGGLLIVGVLRTVFVQHSTFCINSVCHCLGRRPYSTRCSARDSALVALVTFGEGYHNFHHEFQHDYRNGVKWWQFDPTKWTVWTLNKFGLTSDLRRVPAPRILLAELTEARLQIDSRLEKTTTPLSAQAREMVAHSIEAVQAISQRLAARIGELQASARDKMEITRETVREWRRQIEADLQAARRHLQTIHEQVAHLQAVPAAG
jgi:stearoyl-CoA desaturase (delta-9 desaturase)